jgi:RNA polymerase sigma-70 factor (ECF subfamily)
VESFLADEDSVPSDRREDLRDLKAAMQELSSDEQEVIVLKVFCGLTFKEVAEILAQPLGTLASRYARSLERLRSVLLRSSWELNHV